MNGMALDKGEEALQKREGESLAALAAVVRRLRGEGGCPWDRAQTHGSLRRYLIEESYEVVEAIDEGSTAALREELGDLLLQILFHAEIERENGAFDFSHVADDEREKMIRRHPHVFGEANASDVLATWEDTKNAEKGRKTLSDRLATIPPSLPALMRATKLLERADGCLPENAFGEGFDMSALLAFFGEKQGMDLTLAAGRFLLGITEAFRSLGIEAEAALSRAIDAVTAEIARAEKAL